MAADLSGVWAKIARAEEHLALLDAEVRAFIEGDPQPISLSIPYLDTDSGWHLVYGVVEREPPPRLGIILGDVLHNVRSALDHLVWQLVLLNGSTPNRDNAFPMAFREDGWDDAIRKGRLRGVCKTHIETIKKVQPYHGPNGPERTYTGMLSTLSNVDKHRVVHATIAVMLHPDTAPEPARFRLVRGSGDLVRQQVNYGGRIEHRAELMRALVDPLEDDTEIQVDGDIPIDIAFGDGLIPSGYIKNLGSSLFRVGDGDVEFADGEVDHGDVVAAGAVAAGAALGGLDERVESFEQPVGDA